MTGKQLKEILDNLSEEDLNKLLIVPIYDYDKQEFSYKEIIKHSVHRDRINLFLRNE
jgi:hypothetical protein